MDGWMDCLRKPTGKKLGLKTRKETRFSHFTVRAIEANHLPKVTGPAPQSPIPPEGTQFEVSPSDKKHIRSKRLPTIFTKP